MKILLLTTNGTLMDGINRHILAVAPALNAIEGVEAAVCIVQPEGELHGALTDAGVRVWSLGYANGHKLGVYRDFVKVMKAYGPDIVHCHVMALMERIAMARRFPKVPCVATIHGIGDALLEKPADAAALQTCGKAKPRHKLSLKERAERWFNSHYRVNMRAVSYISRGVRSRLVNEKNISEFTPVIYNPIKFDAIDATEHSLRKLIGVDEDTPVIGTACRISAVKQPDIFTRVMCEVLRDNRQAHAVVIGGGDKDIEESCKQIVSGYGHNDRFHWLGFRNNAPQLVGQMDCMVLTSKSEGMPTSVLEAFVARTPVAMLRGEGGLRDIDELNHVDNPIVAIADKDDIEGLADRILRLVEDKDMGRQMADNAYRVAREHFDVTMVAKSLVEFYKRVLSR